ncbi:MAG: potassium transporter KtrB [Lachnospiraceae bacterium]|nr:potassium transporter KtrB [Lachnospiraceae bacterium]
MKLNNQREMSTTQVIMFGFLITILAGSVLLALPISSADGNAVPFLDALFTATSATCVTGLVTLPVVTTWSLFGQIILLLLIQIGGMGVITIMSGLMILFHKRIGIMDRILIQDAFNLNSLSGLVRFVKKVIIGTLLVEGVGAILYMFVFVPEYGAKGIWISVFTSISAFCNAGIDIISEDSLCDYVFHPLVNVVTSLLIILGGLGYIVWWDIIRVARNWKQWRGKCLQHLSLHSKIAISVTLILILAGAAAFYLFEYSNPKTMQDYTLWQRIEVSLFQSVTTRTAGFATIPQQDLTTPSAIVSVLLMFIGGSPVGTAGGIKTVTAAVLVATMIAAVRNKDEVGFFGRDITRKTIAKAVAVMSMSFIILFLSTVLLSVVMDADALDILYETVSATATVGLTRNLTGSLNAWGKMIIIVTMYLGRIGPISLAVAFNTKKESPNIVRNPVEKISIG